MRYRARLVAERKDGMADAATGGWRAWFARWLDDARVTGGGDSGGKAFIKRGWRHTELKFTGNVTQSRMRTFQPDHLLVDYTRTMMGSLLLRPDARLLGMVGLGGGSQAKFCHRRLPGVRVEAVENDAGVLAMRRAFRIPPDDARLQVFHDDGARFLRGRRGRYDILLVDGYDAGGIPEALSTQRWYDDCRDALAPDGVMACNLFCADAAKHVEKLRRSFGHAHVLVLEEKRQSNRVAFAWVGRPMPDGEVDVQARVASLPAGVRLELAKVFINVANAWRAR